MSCHMSCHTQNPQIVPYHAFGINGPIRDNIVTYRDSKDSDHVIFSAANFVVSLDSETKSTRFFEQPPGTANGEITALSISRNEKNIAASYAHRATSGDGAQVFIYRTSNRKRVASLVHRSKVTSMCFSGDSKQLIVAAEDSLNIWSWENQKLDFSAAFEGNITRVSCPLGQFSASTLLIASTGQGYCRLWMSIASTRHHLTNSMITPVLEQKYDYRDHAWLSNVDANDQTLFLAIVTEPLSKDDNGVFNVPCPQETTVNIFKIVDGISSSRPRVELNQSVQTNLRKGVQIMCIAATRSSPGFALGGSNGTLLLFHQEDDCDGKPTFTNTKRLANENHGAIISIQNRNIHEETLLICSEDKRIYELDVGELQDTNCSCTDFYIETGHLGGIDDLDCSIDKPYLVSCGKDRAVRIWNLEQRKCIVFHKNNLDEPQSVAIHPTGFQIAVGYKDKLVMYYVLVDGLKAYREMQCRSAVRCVRFSEGGQYLAVVCGNTISVYLTYQNSNSCTFSLISSFIGHLGAIKHLSWSCDTLFSSGLDRNIYGWDMKHGARIDNLNVLRSFGVCESLVVKNYRTSEVRAAACTSDGKLHTIWWSGKIGDESKVTTLMRANEDKVTTVCLSEDESHLFAGTSGGSVLIYRWDGAASEDDTKKQTQHQEHLSCIHQVSLHCNYPHSSSSAAITCLISKGSQLISAGGIDGALLLSSLKSSALSQHTKNSIAPMISDDTIVLISTDEFEAAKETISEFRERIKTLKNDHEFSIHSKETLWKNELTDLTQKTDEVIEAERQRYVELHTKHEHTIKSHVADLVQRDDSYRAKIHEVEDAHDKRLSEELNRRELLQKEMNSTRKGFDRKLEEQKKECNKKIIEIQQTANTEVRRLKSQLHKLQEDTTESDRIFREILDQQEEEYEMELLKLKSASTIKIHQEKAQTQEIKSVATHLKTKKTQLLRQNDELRSKASFSEDSLKEESASRRKLQSEIIDMKSQISDNENAIQLKDSNFKNLSAQNKSLTTLKLLLETQIEDLRLEKVPLHAKFNDLEKQMISLSYDLSEERKAVTARENERDQFKEKVSCQMRRIKRLEGDVRAMKREFVLLAGLEDDGEVNAKIDCLYRKHITGEKK